MARDSTSAPAARGPALTARAIFAVLALAALLALGLAQRLKDHKALIDSAVWSPAGRTFDPRTQTASFSFTPYYDDRVTVAIVSRASGRTVATVARNLPVVGWHRTAKLPWDGRTARGALAPPGDYEVSVHFTRLDRTTIVPELLLEVGR